MSSDVNSVGNEHVVAFEYFLAIEFGCRKGIKAIQSQYGNSIMVSGMRFRKDRSVRP